MSRHDPPDDPDETTRRGFMKTGLVAGSSLAALSLTATPAAALVGNDPSPSGDPATFANVRVQEAVQAWERGYRGNPLRTLALTDSGTDARHPAVGPWSGVTVTTEDGEFALEREGWTPPGLRDRDEDNEEELGSESYSGTNQGAVVLGLIATHDLSAAEGTDRIAATLEWESDGPSEMEIRLLENGNERASDRGSDSGLEVVYDGYDADSEYEVEIVCWEGVVEYEGEATYLAVEDDPDRGPPEPDEIDPFESVRETGVPELVGWHNDHTRYGGYSRPRDSNGHGTHVASIMTGTGRASAFDRDRYTEDEPRTTLLLGETLSYEVDAEAGTGVFASVYGSAIDVTIEGPDGEELAAAHGASGTSEESFENNVAETPTVHDDGEATYTVRISALEGELVSTGRVESVAVGAFLHPGETAGDTTEGGDRSLHAGVSPGHSLVSVTDLGTAAETVGEFADEFAKTFNTRALNMSWGFAGGLPLVFDGDIPEAIASIAGAGIVPVAAAGNDATPASGNAAPAATAEAISVVATGPRDGIASYSSGGIAGIDDDDEEAYMKPDVTAIGGEVTVLDIAALAGDPEEEVTEEEPDDAAESADLEPVRDLDELDGEEVVPATTIDPDVAGELDYEPSLSTEAADALVTDGDELLDVSRQERQHREEDDGFGGVRDFTGKAGTSMAAPSVSGVVGLVSDAMEQDAPESIALPEPAEAGHEDVLRTKQVVLATASESALTAAPYHTAKAPVYTFGRRDPYEGYGRTNLGAAIDAVTRDLTDRIVSGAVGLDVPRDERAVAGHVRIDEPGEASASVEFSHYSGGNSGATKGEPHIDLFVYDAQNPDPETGDPTIVAREAGIEGDASVSWSVDADEVNDGERVFYVVAKLVHVPGLVNGFDCRAHLDLETAFDEAGLVVSGAREDDASVFTGGQTNHTELDVAVRHPDGEEVLVRDTVPPDWDVDEEHGDVEATTPALDGGTHVYFGIDDAQSVYEDLSHFAEAPDDVAESGRYTFGPIAVTTDTDDEGTLTDREWVTLSGTDRTVTVVAEET